MHLRGSTMSVWHQTRFSTTKHSLKSMIQHATATARLCARRTLSSPKWQEPLGTLNGPARRTLIKHRQHIPINPKATASFFQRRSLLTSINQHELPTKDSNMPAHQKSRVREEHEELLTAVDDIPQRNPATDNETIFAKSTGSDASAIAVIRISGPACVQIYHALCPDKQIPRKRYASVRTLHHPKDRTNILDTDAVVISFSAPNTATGEDMLELHTHGGIATVTAVLSALGQIDPMSIRAANPGEFTRRAFNNNRLDLEQVESLGDILTAETELQRRASLRGPYQQLSHIYEKWRTSLIEELAHAAADTDHSEEHSLDDMEDIWLRIIKKVEMMQDEILYHQKGARCGELLRKGIQVSLIGLPNAGKSSLFNQIVGSEASIVNQQAGTTRDVVEKRINYNDYLCTFADTAGVRAKDLLGGSDIGSIEEEGIKRAIAKAKDADVIVYVASIEPDPRTPSGYKIPLMKNLGSVVQNEDGSAKPLLVVMNKTERLRQQEIDNALREVRGAIMVLLSRYGLTRSVFPSVAVSIANAVAGQRGMDGVPRGNIGGFNLALMHVFATMTSMPVDMTHLIGVKERQSQLLNTCSGHLRDFLVEVKGGLETLDSSIAIHHLEQAAKCLALITGRSEGAGDVEEILDVVFAKFCIGK